MASVKNGYLKEGDTVALKRIDEILARSRKVVEESMELSKRSVEQKTKIDHALETSQSTENSYLIPKRANSNLELSENEENSSQNYEKALEEVNAKIKNLEKKAEADEELLEKLRKKMKSAQKPDSTSSTMVEYEILQADKLIKNLKETLAIGLTEENKKLKQDLETVLKKKSAEESALTKELEDVIKEKKNLEMQYNNLKYLQKHTPNYLEQLENAKKQLVRLEQDSLETINLIEEKIKEQEKENKKLKDLAKASEANIVRVKFGKDSILKKKKQG